MGLVDRADPEQRVGDRDLGLLGERDAGRPRPRRGGRRGRRGSPAASPSRSRRRRASAGGRSASRFGRKPGRPATTSSSVGCWRVVSCWRASFVMSTWTGPGRPVRAMWKASARTRGRSFGVADEVVVLRHRQGDAVDVDLLERVLADQAPTGTLPVIATIGTESRSAVPIPVTRFVAPGPGRAHADADLAGDAGVAVGGVGAALLVADEDVAELGVVAEDVVERQDHAAGVAEEDVDALAEERLADDVGADPGPAPRPRVVEHRPAGLLDGGRVRRPVARHVAPRASGLGARSDSAASPTAPSSSSSLVCPDPCFDANKKPSPPGEGPFGLRWCVRLAPVPPRSSVLPPGAGNEEPRRPPAREGASEEGRGASRRRGRSRSVALVTRRPSVVTTTATWRRSRPLNRPNWSPTDAHGRYPVACARSLRGRSMIAQPPGPH